jgi:uncharacterized damage-inducible protein DinB
MSHAIDIRDLIGYTTWQRAVWQEWFAQKGPAPLAVTTGDHGDGRFPTIGGLIRHIFSSELRYAERIAGLPLTDTTVVATDDSAALFLLGAAGRNGFIRVIETLPGAQWTAPLEFPLLNATVRSTARKVVLHVLTHEIRHWAQVATLLRLQGWMGDRQDLLFSPVLGDPIQL